jgi:hypothetical protein
LIHYTCDFCGSPIHTDDPRFEVCIEVHLSDGEAETRDFDIDDLEAEFLDLLEIGDGGLAGGALHTLRFDLCEDCQAAFLSTPPVKDRPLSLEYNN